MNTAAAKTRDGRRCFADGASTFSNGALLGALALVGSFHLAHAATPPASESVIEIWVRGNGATTGDVSPRGRSQRVSLDRLPLVDAERFDVQYGSVRAFRGVALKTVIDSFAPDASLDLAILHFANGMAVPIPFRDVAAMKRLDPFIARGMETYRKGPVRTGFFPDIPRRGASVDVRPIVFSGNKLVVAEPWHPAVAPKAQSVFSPWLHVDTLADVELCSATAYYHQFDVSVRGVLDVSSGFALFRQSCQFCHGVRKVGAKFGWDFVDPSPIYLYAKPGKNLFYHVRYKAVDAAQRGLMMPALRFMTEEEAALLWEWLRAVAGKPLLPYVAPAATASH